MRESVEVWRLHWEDLDEIITRPANAPPRYRFDDPRAEYVVTYANFDESGAFVEVYGQTQRIGLADRRRRYTQLTSNRPRLRTPFSRATIALNPSYFSSTAGDGWVATLGPRRRP